jgi:multiple sugar transport system permease protein
MSNIGRRKNLLSLVVSPTPKVLKYVVLLAILLYVFLPLAWLLITAVDTNPGAYLKFPDGITFAYIWGIITNQPVKSGSGQAVHPIYMTAWIKNSLILACVSMAVVVVCASLASYALSRLQMRGKAILMTMLLLAGFMPNTAKMLPLFRLCKQLGILNNLPGIGIVVASGSLGMMVWIMKGFFDNIPRDLEEQAWVYGYSRIRALFKVVLPAAGPGLAVIAFLSFMSAWGAFTLPLVLIRKEALFPIAIGISTVLIADPGEVGLSVHYGSICALCVIYTVPSVVIYYVFRKHLMSIRLSKVEVR